MKILTEKDQLRIKLDEIEKSIEYAQEVVILLIKENTVKRIGDFFHLY